MNTRPITLAQKLSRAWLASRMQNFFGNKEMAVAAARRGDRETARFWGAQARIDWDHLSSFLDSNGL